MNPPLRSALLRWRVNRPFKAVQPSLYHGRIRIKRIINRFVVVKICYHIVMWTLVWSLLPFDLSEGNQKSYIVEKGSPAPTPKRQQPSSAFPPLKSLSLLLAHLAGVCTIKLFTAVIFGGSPSRGLHYKTFYSRNFRIFVFVCLSSLA